MPKRIMFLALASFLLAIGGLTPEASAQQCLRNLVLVSGKTNCTDALQMSTAGLIKSPTGTQQTGDYNTETLVGGSTIIWDGPPTDAVIVNAGGGASSAVYVYNSECTGDAVTTSDETKSANEVQFCTNDEQFQFGYADCPIDPTSQLSTDFWAAVPVGLDVVFFKNPNTDSAGLTENDLPAVCCRNGFGEEAGQCNFCDATGVSADLPSCFTDENGAPLELQNLGSESRAHVGSSSVYCPDYLQITVGGVTTCLFSR